MCSTKALLAGDANDVAEIYRERVVYRGADSGAWGWNLGRGEAKRRRRRGNPTP